jgi:hypothetical protein
MRRALIGLAVLITFIPAFAQKPEQVGSLDSYIKDFLDQYDNLDDARARQLADRTFGIEKERIALKEKYFKKMAKVLPDRRVAKFFQLENQMNLEMDLQISTGLPIIE